MKQYTKVLIGAAAIVLSPLSFAGDPAVGQEKAVPCAACHGANGMAQIEGYPNLAGQSAVYLENAMKAYRSGDRKAVGNAAIMAPQATNLTDEDIADLAAFYAGL